LRDGRGNISAIETRVSGDQAVVERETHLYNADNLIVERNHDFDADGNNDSRTTFRYDNGELTDQEEDFDVDGIVDSAIRFRFDELGRQTSIEQSGVNDPGSRLIYQYNNCP